MKITVDKPSAKSVHPPLNPTPLSDLPEKPKYQRKPPSRKSKSSGAGVRLRRDSGAPTVKRSSRPGTPLLRWKFDERNERNGSVEEERSSGEGGRRSGRKVRDVVSARKLGAGLWRLSEFQSNGDEKVGFQPGVGHFEAPIHGHHVDRVHVSPARDLLHSPHSMPGTKHDLLYKFSNSAMEGATKWDPVGWKTSDEWKQIFGRPKTPNHQANAAKAILALETELEQARTRINELENDRRSSKKKLEQFLRKLSEERAAWRSREHEKVRAIIDDMKSDLNREKKNRQRLEIVNSKLVNDLTDAKLSAKRYHQEYEKERKARELIEEVCDELAKEIGEDKTEVEELKRESMKLRDEVEDERKMLQMAEVWREERVQMKLVDAKVMLEEKYSQMNSLVANLESFLDSIKTSSDFEEIKKAEFLRQVAASVNMQDVRELAYEPPNPDDIFSIFEDVNFGESREPEPCDDGYSPASHSSSRARSVGPEVKTHGNKDGSHRTSNVYIDHSELEEDASEWETVSHPEDQGSSYSPEVSRTPIMEISEVDSEQIRQFKKGSSKSNLWRSSGDNYKIISVDGKNGRLSNGRLSNGAIMSPEGLSPQDLSGQWSSPDSANPHITRAMKGCIEWPRGVQKSSLKSRLLEARMESQKIQLRQVLKHKI